MLHPGKASSSYVSPLGETKYRTSALAQVASGIARIQLILSYLAIEIFKTQTSQQSACLSAITVIYQIQLARSPSFNPSRQRHQHHEVQR